MSRKSLERSDSRLKAHFDQKSQANQPSQLAKRFPVQFTEALTAMSLVLPTVETSDLLPPQPKSESDLNLLLTGAALASAVIYAATRPIHLTDRQQQRLRVPLVLLSAATALAACTAPSAEAVTPPAVTYTSNTATYSAPLPDASPTPHQAETATPAASTATAPASETASPTATITESAPKGLLDSINAGGTLPLAGGESIPSGLGFSEPVPLPISSDTAQSMINANFRVYLDGNSASLEVSQQANPDNTYLVMPTPPSLSYKNNTYEPAGPGNPLGIVPFRNTDPTLSEDTIYYQTIQRKPAVGTLVSGLDDQGRYSLFHAYPNGLVTVSPSNPIFEEPPQLDLVNAVLVSGNQRLDLYEPVKSERPTWYDTLTQDQMHQLVVNSTRIKDTDYDNIPPNRFAFNNTDLGHQVITCYPVVIDNVYSDPEGNYILPTILQGTNGRYVVAEILWSLPEGGMGIGESADGGTVSDASLSFNNGVVGVDLPKLVPGVQYRVIMGAGDIRPDWAQNHIDDIQDGILNNASLASWINAAEFHAPTLTFLNNLNNGVEVPSLIFLASGHNATLNTAANGQ